MRRHALDQLVLDLDRPAPVRLPVAPEGLLQALADLLLEALDGQHQTTADGREAPDAAEDHA